MNNKVRVWYQCADKFPIWDFCWSAAFGARQEHIEARPFEDVLTVPGNPHNIIVGSVEESRRWLSTNGFEVPQEIDIAQTGEMMGYTKEAFFTLIEDGEYPLFIKPKGNIKDFTGTVVKNRVDAELVLNWYEGEIWVTDVKDILSEWRCYIHKGKILKTCHYAGDPNLFPDSDFITLQVNFYTNHLKHYNSFVIDFGITPQGTIIVEGNDAWAIANYGLEPHEYLHFLKDRWFQLTGLIK